MLTPPAEIDLHEVGKAHRLLRELWRSCPDVIQNIIPQLEAEVEGENTQLRTLAVETIGDMCAGIGAAGPPPVVPMDPCAYPSQSVEAYQPPAPTQNVLLLPAAPHSFSSVYPNVYSHFASRYKDKAVAVRSMWASAAGRILLTSGGGRGLDVAEEESLLRHLSDLLIDHDERVRLAAVQAIARFDFPAVLQKLCKNGGVTVQGTPLFAFAERIKDPKRQIRSVAMSTLGRIWGVAFGGIAEGSELLRKNFGAIPSKILEAVYVNDVELNVLIQRTLYEELLPVAYPPIRSRPPDSQRIDDSQMVTDPMPSPDLLRAERILVLVRGLEGRGKTVWNALPVKQKDYITYLQAYIEKAEGLYDGKKDTADAKKQFDKVVGTICKTLTLDPDTAAEHLKKFAKFNNKRCFQLMRFCWDADSDYRKIQKSMKELTKRMDEASGGMSVVLETLMPLLRSASMLVYNKSHVHPIVEISRTDDKGLASAAQDVLKEISTQAPSIFKAHVHELCDSLKKQTPSSQSESEITVVETLKACSSFARRFPKEMPRDRDFYMSMVSYATQSTVPKAAKHAVTVIVASADKKEMYIKDIKKVCIDKFKYGAPGFVARLASISQLRLLAHKDCEEDDDRILEIAIKETIGQEKHVAEATDLEWSDEYDEDLEAKLWALRILVNGLRGFKPSASSETPEKDIKTEAQPVYKLLNTLIKDEGELAQKTATPANHKAHLRLAAAVHILKLSRDRKLDSLMLTPPDFINLSKSAQDPLPEVRSGFAKVLKKYLGTKVLTVRFYPLIFLYAFEPDKESKQSTMTWIKSRAAMCEKLQDNSLELSFASFLSLLAHHQDFGTSADEVAEFVEYILFYLKTAASQTNLPRIYHLAQRIKQVQDGIDPSKSENLYVLSDLAEAVIRLYQEIQGWSLQLISARASLPSVLFQRIHSHAEAQRIADKNFIPKELVENLEDLVKNSLKPKKRKAETSSAPAAKKAKKEPSAKPKKSAAPKKAAKPVKTPKKVADPVPSSERRKSTRRSGVQTYAEEDDSDDDEELEQWQEEDDEDEDAVEGASEANKENVESTPPTSDPAPAPKAQSVEKKKAPTKGKRPAGRQDTTPKKSTRQVPVRGGRATRGAKKKEKDEFSVPSDSDEEMEAGIEA